MLDPLEILKWNITQLLSREFYEFKEHWKLKENWYNEFGHKTMLLIWYENVPQILILIANYLKQNDSRFPNV